MTKRVSLISVGEVIGSIVTLLLDAVVMYIIITAIFDYSTWCVIPAVILACLVVLSLIIIFKVLTDSVVEKEGVIHLVGSEDDNPAEEALKIKEKSTSFNAADLKDILVVGKDDEIMDPHSVYRNVDLVFLLKRNKMVEKHYSKITQAQVDKLKAKFLNR